LTPLVQERSWGVVTCLHWNDFYSYVATDYDSDYVVETYYDYQTYAYALVTYSRSVPNVFRRTHKRW